MGIVDKLPAGVAFAHAKEKEIALHELNMVNTSMLTDAQQQYIDILNKAAGLMTSGEISPYVAIKTATQELIDNGLTGFVDKAGRRWEP